MPELETRQILPNIETFAMAKEWLRKMRNQDGYSCRFDLEFAEPSFYMVTKDGQVIGKGLDYKTAIFAAQGTIARSAHSKYIICEVQNEPRPF